MAQSGKCLPSVQSWFQGPGIESCIGLPAQQGVCFSHPHPHPCAHSPSLAKINKIFKTKQSKFSVTTVKGAQVIFKSFLLAGITSQGFTTLGKTAPFSCWATINLCCDCLASLFFLRSLCDFICSLFVLLICYLFYSFPKGPSVRKGFGNLYHLIQSFILYPILLSCVYN